MIDINELRRLAQAATPGPDGVSLSWITLLQDFQQAANPAVINELLDRLESAEADALEQSRLLGMGASREAALMARLEAAEKSDAESIAMYRKARDERDELRAKVEAMERQEPVCITTKAHLAAMENGAVHSIVGRNPVFSTRGDKDVPLYLAPGAQTQGERK